MDSRLLETRLDKQEIPESIWQVKPWWCQPWSIVLTGLAIPTLSWPLLHRLWITALASGAIALWWVLFLGLVPAQYAAVVRETQKGRIDVEKTRPKESMGEKSV